MGGSRVRRAAVHPTEDGLEWLFRSRRGGHDGAPKAFEVLPDGVRPPAAVAERAHPPNDTEQEIFASRHCTPQRPVIMPRGCRAPQAGIQNKASISAAGSSQLSREATARDPAASRARRPGSTSRRSIARAIAAASYGTTSPATPANNG